MAGRFESLENLVFGCCPVVDDFKSTDDSSSRSRERPWNKDKDFHPWPLLLAEGLDAFDGGIHILRPVVKTL